MPLKYLLGLPLPTVGVILLVVALSYVIYHRYLHPLAKYPGPFVASLTNFWKAYQYSTLRFHHNMVDVHARYGPVVRIGPNDLSFSSKDAIGPIYKSGGRLMPKAQFYDAFTAFEPNVFGTRNESVICSCNFHASLALVLINVHSIIRCVVGSLPTRFQLPR